MKLYILLFALLGAVSVSQAQLRGLAAMLAGPKGGILKILARRFPLLQRGLATLQDMKVAKSLGCRQTFDNDSPLHVMWPSGCSPRKDFCPYTKPLMKCVKVGMVGMCCPYMVNIHMIKRAKVVAKMVAKWRKFSEVMA